ncbi:MAG TPA: class I SAM-dependent methyltransferase [Planctomycetota bacterium]|nr:class I SAM-dependent methyltransferase [Planctomycetota bacterium]
MTTDARAMAAMYETLSRWQWWRRRWARARAGEGLELRKRLLPSTQGGPADGGPGLDRWLQAKLDGRPAARVLDLGCGFGASLLRWIERGDAVGVGVTQSAFQIARATAEARRRGLAARCRFLRQDFTAPVDGDFDVVLAVEALGHALDLDSVLQHVHAVLRRGGTFVWIEDLLRHPLSGDLDVAEVARRWGSPPLRDVVSARDAIGRAGLRIVEETDLSAQVPILPVASALARSRRLGRLHACLPLRPLRRLVDAFAGGLALQRLYARGLACYRVWVSERPAAVA